MKTKGAKRLSVDLVPDFHAEVKGMARAQAKTLKSYVIDALTERFQKDRKEEDRLWAEIAERAVEEGFLNDKETEDLIQRIKNA